MIMIKNRFASFAIIIAVYVIAVAAGIVFYNFLEQWEQSAGLPMADKHQSRKSGFDEYKKATRIL